MMMGSSTTIVEELLKEKEHSQSALKTSEPSPNKKKYNISDSNSSHEMEAERVNLQKLISTATLI